MSQTRIYENCRADGQSRAHFGDNYYHYSSTTEEELILDWLSPRDHSDPRNTALRSYQPDTLRWFFDDPTFKSWVDLDLDADYAASARILWCRGDMGTGKSVLASKIGEELLEDSILENYVALVFCSWIRRNEQTFEAIIGSVLAQLCLRDIPQNVRDTYRRRCSHGRHLRPSRGELESWINEFATSTQKLPVIILDGLDELQPAVRSEILYSLQSSPLSRVKILVTSRFPPDRAEVREEVSLVEFCSARSDVEHFIVAAFQKPASCKLKTLIEGETSLGKTERMTADCIVSQVLAKSRGM